MAIHENYILGRLINLIRDLDCWDKTYANLGGGKDKIYKKKLEDSALSKIIIYRIKEL